MKTEVLRVNSKTREFLDCAAELIKRGEIVAFPTETVYGLGADALNQSAVAKIFVAKNRPANNPLIVHIAKISDLKKLVKGITPLAKVLIKKFWPGPLTLVFKKKAVVPDIVTGGLDSVAVRMPANKIALEFIKRAGPIAAPSANISGSPSPTTANHVFGDMNGRIPMILDGGSTKIGIESTVLDLTSNPPQILRPGKVTFEQLKTVIPDLLIAKVIPGKEVRSPGMLYKHYSPKAKVILANKENIKELVSFYKNKKVAIIAKQKHGIKEAFLYKTNKELAKNLFEKFRDFDEKKVDVIIVEAVKETGLGLGIMNRLKKAAKETI